MELSDLIVTPTLTPVVLDDEDTVKKYGEPMTFYTLLPMPIETFLKFQMRETFDLKTTIDILKDVILDKDGKQIIVGLAQPKNIGLLFKAVTKLTEEMGKLQGES
jgi:hypothetical protein